VRSRSKLEHIFYSEAGGARRGESEKRGRGEGVVAICNPKSEIENPESIHIIVKWRAGLPTTSA
jgi:hypothetical protein